MSPPLSVPRREFLRRAALAAASLILGGGAAALGGVRLARRHPRLTNWVTEISDSLELQEQVEGFLTDRARDTLRRHVREGRVSPASVTYLIPSEKYRNYWYWDNMLGALAAAYVDPELAAKLLRSQASIYRLLGRHGPQILYFHPSRVPLEGRVFMTARGREGVDQLTQTPNAGLALQAYLRLTGDLETVREVLPDFGSHYAWLAEARAIHRGVDLPVTIHPFESLDAQPAVDLMYGRSMARTGTFQLFALRTHRHNRGHHFKAEAIARSGGIVLYDTCFLSFYAAGLYGLAEAWRRVGDEGQGAQWQRRAERATESLIRTCYDPRTGFFYCRRANRGRELLRVRTASGLLPLLLPLPAGIVRRLVDQLIEPTTFVAEDRYLPFVARDEPSHQEAVEPLWRGPGSAVMDFAVILGLHRNGVGELARELFEVQEIRSLLSYLSGHPFPEFYTPTHAHRGPYTWGTLAACNPARIQ